MALITGTRLLGEILIADGVTTPEMVTAALNRMQTTGERLGEALVALGAVTKDDVLKALAVQHNLPYLFRAHLPPAGGQESVAQISAPVRRVPDRRRGRLAHRRDRGPAQSDDRGRPSPVHRPRDPDRGESRRRDPGGDRPHLRRSGDAVAAYRR